MDQRWLYDEERTSDSALKNHLLAVFDKPYLVTLKKNYTSYATSSTIDLIKHIYKRYIRIPSTDMAANDKRLQASYNAEEPLKSLTKRINKYADFSTAASKSVSDTQLLLITYGLVSNTGQYPEDCRAWRNQDYKSWKSFQTHFIEAQADLIER